jgi:ABC-2 type transport system ATP-binding protein
MDRTEPAVICDNLGRVYARRAKRATHTTVALAGLNLEIPRGCVYGLLGPNGAGKTTTVRILSTLLTPSSGTARVLGHDVEHDARAVRRRIGLVLGGDRGLYGQLTGRENLRYFAALSHIAARDARASVDNVLRLVSMTDDADRLVEQYSRGMRQRIHIARGLLTDPDVIFMDEPTTGLDPESADELRRLVPQLVDRGKTILLTTHYMLEADQLCARLAIIDHGRVVVEGPPSRVKDTFARVHITEITTSRSDRDLIADLEAVDGVARIVVTVDGPYRRIGIHTDPTHNVEELLRPILAHEELATLRTRPPTLEEAYLSIVANERRDVAFATGGEV